MTEAVTISILIAVGVLLWCVNTFIPMDEKISKILNAVIVIAVILWVLTLFLPGTLSQIHVGRS